MSDQEQFSNIELELLKYSASGLQYKDIAHKLGRSENNVKWHALILRAKLGAKTMVEAVAKAIRRKIID